MRRVEEAYDVGVIVGRFQVDRLHKIHEDLIDTVIAAHPRVVLFIGETVVPSAENPLTFEARRQMIHAAYAVEVRPIMDHWSNDIWSANLDRAIREVMSPTQTVVLYGGRDSFLNSYTGKFSTRELTADTVESGTAMRALIANSTTVNSPDFRAGVIWANANRFPQTHAVVDVCVIHPDHKRFLLGRRTGSHHWQFPGGFVDITDASLEHAAIREVREETNVWLSIPRVHYVASREVPDWRYSGIKLQRIMSHVFIGWGEPAGVSIMAGDDLNEVAWFDFDKFDRDALIDNHKPLYDLVMASK